MNFWGSEDTRGWNWAVFNQKTNPDAHTWQNITAFCEQRTVILHENDFLKGVCVGVGDGLTCMRLKSSGNRLLKRKTKNVNVLLSAPNCLQKKV